MTNISPLADGAHGFFLFVWWCFLALVVALIVPRSRRWLIPRVMLLWQLRPGHLSSDAKLDVRQRFAMTNDDRRGHQRQIGPAEERTPLPMPGRTPDLATSGVDTGRHLLAPLGRATRKAAQESLAPTEVVLGAWRPRSGTQAALVCTNRRVLIVKRGTGQSNIHLHSYRYADILSVDVKLGSLNPLRSALTKIYLTVGSSSPVVMTSRTSLSSAARLMDAPNAVAFGFSKSQKADARAAIHLIEDMIEAARTQ